MGKPTNANAITSGPSGQPLWASPLNAWPHLWSSFSIQTLFVYYSILRTNPHFSAWPKENANHLEEVVRFNI